MIPEDMGVKERREEKPVRVKWNNWRLKEKQENVGEA